MQRSGLLYHRGTARPQAHENIDSTEEQCALAAEIGSIYRVARSHSAVDRRTRHSTLAEIVWIYAAEFGRGGDITL